MEFLRLHMGALMVGLAMHDKFEGPFIKFKKNNNYIEQFI